MRLVEFYWFHILNIISTGWIGSALTGQFLFQTLENTNVCQSYPSVWLAAKRPFHALFVCTHIPSRCQVKQQVRVRLFCFSKTVGESVLLDFQLNGISG